MCQMRHIYSKWLVQISEMIETYVAKRNKGPNMS